jgi:hypothetical protein
VHAESTVRVLDSLRHKIRYAFLLDKGRDNRKVTGFGVEIGQQRQARAAEYVADI